MARVEQGRRRTAAETRRAILAAARRLVERQGVERVRLEDVARAAHCSRRAVYLHFRSRTALLLALVDHIDEEEDVRASLARIWDAPSALAALDGFAAHVADYHGRIAAAVEAADRARRVDEAAGTVYADRMQAWRDVCRRIVEWLDREAFLAAGWSVGEAADLLWAFMSVRFRSDLVVERGWNPERFAERLAEILRATLTADRSRD